MWPVDQWPKLILINYWVTPSHPQLAIPLSNEGALKGTFPNQLAAEVFLLGCSLFRESEPRRSQREVESRLVIYSPLAQPHQVVVWYPRMVNLNIHLSSDPQKNLISNKEIIFWRKVFELDWLQLQECSISFTELFLFSFSTFFRNVKLFRIRGNCWNNLQ